MRPHFIKRLQTLRDYVRDHVPDREFNMGFWFFKSACRTVGCALGHGCTIPEFNKAGLRLVKAPASDYGSAEHFVVRLYGRGGKLRGMGAQGAGARFFGITEQEAGDLFLSSSYYHATGAAAKAEFVRKINKLIAQYSQLARKQPKPKTALAKARR